MKDYRKYNAEEFAKDDHFQRWILRSSPEVGLIWREWLEKYPFKRDEVEEAREILLLIGMQEVEVSEEQTQRMKQNILWRINQGRHVRKGDIKAEHSQKRLRLKVAAVISGMLLLAYSLVWFYDQRTYVEYVTDYGEKKEIVLPDGSLVTLNANTRLWYPGDWNMEEGRAVWLEGEAFFSVNKELAAGSGDLIDKKPDVSIYRKFLVHTFEVAIVVIGTEFNVNTHEQETEVVLKSGKVDLMLNNKENHKRINMEPGEIVKVQRGSYRVSKQEVDPKLYTYGKIIYWFLMA